MFAGQKWSNNNSVPWQRIQVQKKAMTLFLYEGSFQKVGQRDVKIRTEDTRKEFHGLELSQIPTESFLSQHSIPSLGILLQP